MRGGGPTVCPSCDAVVRAGTACARLGLVRLPLRALGGGQGGGRLGHGGGMTA